MAKDVVFESEKYMQRQETLRKWMPLICFAAILLAVIVIALIIRGTRGTVNTGGEDTPYPYSWSVDRKGVLTLEIDKSAAEGYSWALTDFDIARLNVEWPEKAKDGVSTFKITPDEAGRYICVFDLLNLQDRSDCKYEWRFIMDSGFVTEGETTSAGPLSILSGSGMELGGKQRSTEEEAVSYTIQADIDGNVTVEIINPEQGREDNTSSVPMKDPDEEDASAAQYPASEPVLIEDPEEIEAALGMPLEDYIAMMEEYKAETAAGTPLYNYYWTFTSENESVAVPAGIFYTGEMAIASLNPGPEDGTVSVSVHNDILGLEVYAEVMNKEGRLSILNYGSKSYDPVTHKNPAELIQNAMQEETEEGTEESTEETVQP